MAQIDRMDTENRIDMIAEMRKHYEQQDYALEADIYELAESVISSVLNSKHLTMIGRDGRLWKEKVQEVAHLIIEFIEKDR